MRKALVSIWRAIEGSGRGVAEPDHHALLTLDGGVGDCNINLAVEAWAWSADSTLEEGDDMLHGRKADEAATDVAITCEICPQALTAVPSSRIGFVS